MALTVSDATFSKEVLQEASRFVLVDFWAEWCGPCRMLAPIIESISKKFEATVKVCKLDTDANPETSQHLQITSIPCCILFKDGREVSRLIGYKPESQFSEELIKLISI